MIFKTNYIIDLRIHRNTSPVFNTNRIKMDII